MVTTPEKLVIGSIKMIAKLQSTKYCLNFNVNKMEYLPELDVHLMLMDTFKNGSFTPEDE